MDFFISIIEPYTYKLIVDAGYRQFIGLIITISSGIFSILFGSLWQIANHRFNLNKFFTDLNNNINTLDNDKKKSLLTAYKEYVTLDNSDRFPLLIMTLISYVYFISIFTISVLIWFYVTLIRDNTKMEVGGFVFGLTGLILFHLIIAIMFRTYRPTRYVGISRKIRNCFLECDEEEKKMSKNYRCVTLRGAITAGVFGAIAFALAFGLGGIVNAATGVPLTGGILNGIIVGAVITLALIRTENEFGVATILWIVFTSLAIGTTTFGPPGLYKVPVGFASGLIWDISLWLLQKRSNKLRYPVSSGIGAVAITILVFFAVKFIGLPSADKLQQALVFLVPMNLVISALGAMLGVWLHNRFFSQDAED